MLKCVLFDFHGTLAQVEDPVTWVVAAAAGCGHDLDPEAARVLAERLIEAGRAGGPFPATVPPELAEVWAARDLSPESARAAYAGLAATVECGIDGLPDALYERILGPDGWELYADTLPVLKTLKAAGVPVAVVSNIGFDIRPIADGLGFGSYVDAYALSYELGVCKPDPAIFTAAARMLGVDPADALMVGDTGADAAAADAGCRTLILPTDPPGVEHGLREVLALVGVEC